MRSGKDRTLLGVMSGSGASSTAPSGPSRNEKDAEEVYVFFRTSRHGWFPQGRRTWLPRSGRPLPPGQNQAVRRAPVTDLTVPPADARPTEVQYPAVVSHWLAVIAAAALAAMLLLPLSARAAPVDPGAARGKSVLYVSNMTKLEAARTVVPVDPKRIAALEAWRRNDLAVVAYLQSLGFQVKQVDEHALDEATAGQALILISESVDAIEVGGKYRNVPVPLITFENDLLGDLGMAGQKSGRDYGTDDGQRFIWVVNAPHPLAAGLEAGLQNVLSDEHFKMNWGKPGLGAATIATLRGEPDKAAIFAYERGATMNGDFLAPARRVSFFLWQDTFEGLRPEGLALFRAAVLWAVTRPR